jgi:sulfur carrier protein ThiS
MPVTIIYRDEEYQVKAGMTLWDALKKIDVQPESVLAAHEGTIITEDEILKEDQVIQLIDVISGGSGDDMAGYAPESRYKPGYETRL